MRKSRSTAITNRRHHHEQSGQGDELRADKVRTGGGQNSAAPTDSLSIYRFLLPTSASQEGGLALIVYKSTRPLVKQRPSNTSKWNMSDNGREA
jgi:hypothetical protein